MAILKEFKQIVEDKTGKNFFIRKLEAHTLSKTLGHNFDGGDKFFRNYIVEVKFLRKLEPDSSRGQKRTRRMICTRNFFFAKRFAKHFGQYDMPRRPKHKRKKSWYKQREIILVWDLLENKYRMVHLKKWKIMDFIPITVNNINIINDFAQRINPRRLTEAHKTQFYRK